MPTADLVWGFDTAKVSEVLCMSCGQPIGSEKYFLDTTLARFGQMMFEHERCAAHPNLKCDQCNVLYPDWTRCIHCAHYFCSACMDNHGCGVKFKCAEQVEAEAMKNSIK